jgi:hypothetical protein
MSDIVINENVDNLLKELEVYFTESVEGKKPLQLELDKKVKELMDEYDEKDEVKKFENVKAIVDYITLTLSMPLEDELKEKIVEKLVKECEEKYGITSTKEV